MLERKLVKIEPEHFAFRGHSELFFAEAVLEYYVYEGEVEFTSMVDFACGNCGERPTLQLKEGKLTTATACPWTPGPFSVKLAVSSGKLVFADTLFHVFTKAPYSEELSLNSSLGRKKNAEYHEKQGLVYGTIGNTSPSVYWDTVADELLVANGRYDEEAEVEEEGVPATWRKLGHITTDLWAYCFADYEHYRSLPLLRDMREPAVTIAEVPAGTYEFTNFYEEVGFDEYSAELTIFARARRLS